MNGVASDTLTLYNLALRKINILILINNMVTNFWHYFELLIFFCDNDGTRPL